MAFGFENVQLRQLNERKGSDGMKKKLSVKRIFLISLAVFLVGLMLASFIAVNGGKTEMRRLYVMTDRGVGISLGV